MGVAPYKVGVGAVQGGASWAPPPTGLEWVRCEWRGAEDVAPYEVGVGAVRMGKKTPPDALWQWVGLPLILSLVAPEEEGYGTGACVAADGSADVIHLYAIFKVGVLLFNHSGKGLGILYAL